MPHPLSDTIDLYLTWLTAQGYSPATVRAYRSDLDLWTAWVVDLESKSPMWTIFQTVLNSTQTGSSPTNWTLLSRQVETIAGEWLTENRDAWAPATVVRRVAAVRSFGRWVFKDDTFLSHYRSPQAPAMKPHPVSGGISSVIVMATQAERPHHKALIALCGLLGLRVSEARAVTPEDFRFGGESMRHGGADRIMAKSPVMLTVRGKGDKTRRLEVHPQVWNFLAPAFERAWRDDFAGTGPCQLVPIKDRAARAYITRHGIRETGHPVASHDLRSTFATASYANTQDLGAVQELMGHADPATTKGYTEISDEAKRKATDFFTIKDLSDS